MAVRALEVAHEPDIGLDDVDRFGAQAAVPDAGVEGVIVRAAEPPVFIRACECGGHGYLCLLRLAT